MISKKSLLLIVAAVGVLAASSMFTQDTVAQDYDTPQSRTDLCSNCDNWFIANDSSQRLCPRCELLKDLTLLKTDPNFTAGKLEPQAEAARREIAKKIETLEQSLWAKPNLCWTDTY